MLGQILFFSNLVNIKNIKNIKAKTKSTWIVPSFAFCTLRIVKLLSLFLAWATICCFLGEVQVLSWDLSPLLGLGCECLNAVT